MVNVKQEVRLREAATKKYLAALKSQNMKSIKNIPEIEDDDDERWMIPGWKDMMELRDMEEEDKKLMEESYQQICKEQNSDMDSTEIPQDIEGKIEDIISKMRITEDSVTQMEKEMDQLNKFINEEGEAILYKQLLIEHPRGGHMTTNPMSDLDQLPSTATDPCAPPSTEPHSRITQELWEEPWEPPFPGTCTRTTQEPWVLPPTEPTCVDLHPAGCGLLAERLPSAQQTRETQQEWVPGKEDMMVMNVKRLVMVRESVKEQKECGVQCCSEALHRRDRKPQVVPATDNDNVVYQVTDPDNGSGMEVEAKMMVNVKQLIQQREAMTIADQSTGIKCPINVIKCDPEANMVSSPLDNADYPRNDRNVQRMADILINMRYSHNQNQHKENIQATTYNRNFSPAENNNQSMRHSHNVQSEENVPRNIHDVHQPGENVQDINPQHLYSVVKIEEEQSNKEEEAEKGNTQEERLPGISTELYDETNKTNHVNKLEDVCDIDNMKMRHSPATLLTKEKVLQYVKGRRKENGKKREELISALQNKDNTRTTGEDMTPMVNVREMIQKREEAWQQVLIAEQKHRDLLDQLRDKNRSRTPTWEKEQLPMSAEYDDGKVGETAQTPEEQVVKAMGHLVNLVKEEEDVQKEMAQAERQIQDLKDEVKAREEDVRELEKQIVYIQENRKEEVSKLEVGRDHSHGRDEDISRDPEEEDTMIDEDEEPDSPSPLGIRSPLSRPPSLPRPPSLSRSRSPAQRRTPSPPRSPRPTRTPRQSPINGVLKTFESKLRVTEQLKEAVGKIKLLKDTMRGTVSNVHEMEKKIEVIKNERKAEERKLHEIQSRAGSPILSTNQMEAILSNFCPLTLDPNTANKQLLLSNNNTVAKRVNEKQDYADHPHRFDYWSQVLCREPLTGRCYWEVEWRKQMSIAVVYSGIPRRGLSDECALGHNANSWSLEGYDVPSSSYGLQGARYIVRHDRKKEQLPICPSGSNRVGVYLDWTLGILSFYSISPGTRTHLYTFQTKFTEPLYAAFWCWMDDSFVALCPKEDIK